MKKLVAGLFLVALVQPKLYAAEEILPSASLAFPSIQQAGSARAIGLGSTYVGIAEGSSTLLWNPAGLATLLDTEISFHHNSALLGANQEMLILGMPFAHGNGLGLAINYEDNGNFDGRDSSGVKTGDYSNRGFGANLGWGIRGPAGLSFGLALKANRQQIADTSIDAISGDLGVLWNLTDSFNLGVAYTNLGPDVSGNPLAQGVRLGMGAYIGKCSDFQWLLALSGEAMTHGANSIHAGVEATVYQSLALRVGYGMDIPNAEVLGLNGWTFGGGILLKKLSLDYAYVPLETLGAMHRVSLTYAFGDRCKLDTRSEVVSPDPVTPKPAAYVVPEKTPVPVPVVTSERMGNYAVQRGDSLWKISGKDKVLGDSFRWPLIFKANREQIADPDQIEPDQNLRFKLKYTNDEIDQAVQKAKDTPPYVPHSAPRQQLPVKY